MKDFRIFLVLLACILALGLSFIIAGCDSGGSCPSGGSCRATAYLGSPAPSQCNKNCLTNQHNNDINKYGIQNTINKTYSCDC